MPRRSLVRSDGVAGATPDNPRPHPNGRPLTTQEVPTGLPYGERGQLQGAIRQTPSPSGVGTPGSLPPNITPQADAARQALS